MKNFFISLLKALGYFGIYLGAQFLVTFVYMFFASISVAGKYALGNYDLTDPLVFNQYMDEVTQLLLEASMPITILTGLLTVGIICLVFLCRKKKLAKELSFRKISGGTALSAALMGFGFNYVLGLLFLFLPEEWIASYAEASDAAFTGEFWIIAVAIVIMAPLVEEIVFRGLIYTRLKKGMPVAAAAVITAVWFGVMHGHPLWIAYAALFGLVMIWIFERTKSLFGSMAFHFGYNLLAAISMALPENIPDWVGLVMLGVGVLASVVGVYWFLKIPKAVEVPESDETAILPADAEAVPVTVTEEQVVVTEEKEEETTENFK